MIGIHKEGKNILMLIFLFLFLINVLIAFILKPVPFLELALIIVSLLLMIFFLRFFRKPLRTLTVDENILYSPADGKVVVIEEITEEEYFKDKRIQLSIFMSAWDVHINYFPVSGKVKFYRYHPGKYLVARYPKSSTLNERNTIVIETPSRKEFLVRQIAGIVARKISTYCKEGDAVIQGEEMGFIKFGSRVDVFLPPGTEILTKLGNHVTGKKSPLAKL